MNTAEWKKTWERQCCPFAQVLVDHRCFVLLALHSVFQRLSSLSLQSLNFIRKLLIKFFCSITFKNVQIICQNGIFVAEIHA